MRKRRIFICLQLRANVYVRMHMRRGLEWCSASFAVNGRQRSKKKVQVKSSGTVS